MSIIRIKKRETPYVQIDKRCLEDTRLSWRARGVLAYLLSKPDNWQVSVADIKSKGLEGRDAILKSLKELEKIGYASFGPTRGKDGKVCGTAWTIAEEPTNGFSVCRLTTEPLKNRKSEKPIIGKSVPSNNEYNSNNEKEEEVKVISTTSVGDVSYNLEAEKKTLPPVPAAPLPAVHGRVDVQAEIERLRTDRAAVETFVLNRRIPEAKYDTYISDFSREVSGTGEAYWKLTDFRRHFFNWCDKRYRIEQDQATKSATPGAKSSLPTNIRRL